MNDIWTRQANGFTTAQVDTMLGEANERYAMVNIALASPKRIEHAVSISGLPDHEIIPAWHQLAHFYEAQRFLALALLADTD